MPITKPQVLEDLSEKLKTSTGLYFADFSRIQVGTVTALRASMRKKGIRMKVAKNTLIRRALGEAGISGLDSYLTGPTMVLFADDQDPMAPAKALVDFHKTNEGLLPMKAVSIDKQAYPGDQLANLAKMPGKKELQAQVVSLALGPGAQLIGIIKGPAGQVAGQIKALIEKLEKQAG